MSKLSELHGDAKLTDLLVMLAAAEARSASIHV
jgi:hypothetical protein